MSGVGKLIKKLILDEFKVAVFAGQRWDFFIFPDGQIAGSETHLNMLDTCYSLGLVTDEDYYAHGSRLLCEETGAIQLSQRTALDNYIRLNNTRPTAAQYEKLALFLTQNSELYGAVYVTTEAADQNFKYQYSDYTTAEIISCIKNYYVYGKLCEKQSNGYKSELFVHEGFTIEKVSVYNRAGYFINDIGQTDLGFRTLLEAKQYIDSNRELLEDTRSALIAKSKSMGDYKDQSKGKNRFDRKKFSTIAKSVKNYNQIDMNKFFKEDTLIVKVPVIGETNSYEVSIKVSGVVAELAKLIKANKNKFEFSTMLQALTKAINVNDVYVHCNCPDSKFTFDFWNIVKGVSTLDSSQNPGPGKGIRNPKDEKGRGCKHILLVLSNLSWLMPCASTCYQYIIYMDEHQHGAFSNIIFPKLYGTLFSEARNGIFLPAEGEAEVDTKSGVISAINNWAVNKNKSNSTKKAAEDPKETTSQVDEINPKLGDSKND